MRLVLSWFDRSRQVECSPCIVWWAWWSGYLLNEEEVGLFILTCRRRTPLLSLWTVQSLTRCRFVTVSDTRKRYQLENMIALSVPAGAWFVKFLGSELLVASEGDNPKMLRTMF